MGGTTQSVSRCWQEAERISQAALWDHLPPLTVLAALPGWGRTTWLRQCQQHQGGATRWISTRSGVQHLLESAEPGVVAFIDDVLQFADDPLWPALLAHVAAHRGVRVVVSTIDLPPEHPALEMRVLDERHLALTGVELDRVVQLNAPSAPPDQTAGLATDLRGCPALVRRHLERLHRADGLWVGPGAGLPVALVPELPGATQGEWGRLIEATRGLRAFSAETLRDLLPDLSPERRAAYLDRLGATALVEVDVDGENGREVTLWDDRIWAEFGRLEAPPARRRRLEAALAVVEAQGWHGMTLYHHLILGDTAGAEALAFTRFRLFLWTLPGVTAKLFCDLSAQNLAGRPNLLLLAAELHTRSTGTTGPRRFVEGALAALPQDPEPDPFISYRILCRRIFAHAALGDRRSTLRGLAQAEEMLGGPTGPGLLASAGEDPTVMADIAAESYLPFWAATQVDRHELAHRFSHIARTHQSPGSLTQFAETMTARTQETFLGLAADAPPSGHAHADPLTLLERGDDTGALEMVRALASRNRTAPSRSTADAFLLALQALLAPTTLDGNRIGDALEASRAFWSDHRPGTFLVLATTLAHLVRDDLQQASRVVGEHREPDWFTSVAAALLCFRKNRPQEAMSHVEAALASSAAPRAQVIARILLAVGHLRLGREEAASLTVRTTLQRYPAGQVRLALRLVCDDDFDALARLGSADPSLPTGVFVAADPRPLRSPEGIRLTAVEDELIRLLRRGLTNQEIAAVRTVSVNTVRTQVRTLMQKVGAANRRELVERAEKLGLF